MVKNQPLDELVIVTIKNISTFDFTPNLGAMFGGRPYFVKVGETLQMPEPAGYRMAVNLAKAILNDKMPIAEGGKGDDRSTLGAYSEEDVDKLVAEIIISTTREEKKPVLSETDRINAKIEELNNLKAKLEEKYLNPTETTEQPTGNPNSTVSSSFTDKAEVIAELEKRGIKFDRRQNKANLEKLLA